jgi:SAM-dependent methyltransferase
LSRLARTPEDSEMREPTVPLPPFEMKTWVCGAGAEDLFEEVGRGAVAFMKALGMVGENVRLLDVGCGCGRVARFLLDESLESYVGFDRSPAMIDWCRENLAKVDTRFRFDFFSIQTPYEKIDGVGGEVSTALFAIPYELGAFDSILLTSVFTHMALNEIQHYLGELRRVLAPSGRILASILFAESEPYDNGVDFWHRPGEWTGLLERAGFSWKELAPRRFGGGQNYFLLIPE